MIIGLVGLIGNGKGTVADILVRNHGFEKMAFADPLKDAASSIFGWDRSLLEGDTKTSREFRECPDPFWSKWFGRDFTPREALQVLGTQSGRDVFGEDLWVRSLQRRVANCDNKNIVIADTRFKNEIDAIHKMNGEIIQIKRGPDPEWYDELINLPRRSAEYSVGVPRPLTANTFMRENYPEVHISEWAWVGLPVNYILYNDGSLDELEANVNYMLTRFKGPCKITA